MSKDQKVVLVLQKEDICEQNRIGCTHPPDVRIIALVGFLARHAAEQDFRTGLSNAGLKLEDGKET